MTVDHSFRKQNLKNVEISVENKILTIKVDLSKNYGPSKSMADWKFTTGQLL
ncbi:MAG: hypothetical protein QGG48_07535 [Desulfatiglandales bacterium]|nr:hypothetical protein [Desulfatiglandales bacterium]